MATSASSRPSRNPFRTPAPTPQATGASYSSSTGAPPPPASSAAPSDPTGLTDEAPPAYTPGPDVYQGEETIEYGPRRPFQPPPPALPGHHAPQQRPHPPAITTQPQSISPSPSQPHTPSLWRQITGQIAAQLANPPSTSRPPGGWSAYPGGQEPSHTGAGHGSSGSRLQVPPPPRHPSTSNPTTTPAPISTSTSEFARDFYAAGPEPSRSAPTSPSGYAPPPGPPPAQHALPPGPPPIPSHGRPTDTPTPGHPLLRAGKLLVYPRGYECEKCHNLGYKHADPTHPCKKCWPKYAKPFQGPLAYAYSAGEAAPGAGATTFQRPLPDFHPPHLGSRSAPTSPVQPPLPPRPHRGFEPPQSVSLFSPPQPLRNVHTLSPYTPPPPGAVVYAAGDPRIGGRPCWNCAGRGSVSLFLFDSMTCDVCGGVGRVF